MDKIEFYSKFIKQQTLNEMAGPGKRGPKSKAEKEAEAAAAKIAEKENKARIEKANIVNKDFHENFAPRHANMFRTEVENHLKEKGFSKIHEGPKRSVYTKLDPENEHFHGVVISHPTHNEDVETYNRHATDVQYINHSGTGYSRLNYNPDKIKFHDNPSNSETHEKGRRQEVIRQLEGLVHKAHFWI